MDRHGRPAAQRPPASNRSLGSNRGRTESRHRSAGDQSVPRASSRDSNGEESSRSNQLFACPYAKYDYNRYSHVNIDDEESEYRNCSTGKWTSISRLKQHLYRTHDKSQRCPNCWKHFPTEKSLNDHVEKRSCATKTEPEGLMSRKQRDAVSRRGHGQDVEKWLRIYQVLFPDDELPGSVYPEWVTGKDFRTCFELLDKALPTYLYQKFAQNKPNLRGQRPNTNTVFETNAEIIQEVLEYCKQRFISGMGHRMGPVFADEPLEAPQIHDSSSSGQNRPKDDRHSSPSDDSDDEMPQARPAPQRSEQQQHQQQVRQKQQAQQTHQPTTHQGMTNCNAQASLAFRPVTTGYSHMPMVTPVDPMQTLLQSTGGYYQYNDMTEYDEGWQHQQLRH